MLPNRPSASGGAQDLALGFRGLLLWVPPVVLLSVAGALRSAAVVDDAVEGALVVVGTTGFALLCLTNALRCGRVHCWIDGIALSGLAAIGVGILLGAVRLGWSSFVSAVWLVIVASFVVEWSVGRYVRARRPSPSG